MNAKNHKKSRLKAELQSGINLFRDISQPSLCGHIVVAHAQLVAALFLLVRDPPAWRAIGRSLGVGHCAGKGNNTCTVYQHNASSALNLFPETNLCGK